MGFIIDCTIYLGVSLRTGLRNACRGEGGEGDLRKKQSEKGGGVSFFSYLGKINIYSIVSCGSGSRGVGVPGVGALKENYNSLFFSCRTNN